MVAIISKNALLAADVLRIANSPAMRPKQVIKTIPQAVAILGTVNLKNMVLASALKQAFGGNGTIREIMDNSADVAFCMAELANGVHGVSPDEAYLCGLFHNCWVSTGWMSYNYLKSQYLLEGCKSEILEFLQPD